jgi:inositol phosphorylceramide synthase catalytic subunit
MSLWTHSKALWPRYTLLPVIPLPLYTAFMASQGMLRWDHVALTVIFVGLAYAHPKTKAFLVAFMGFFLTGIVYDAGRFIRDLGVTEERVINCGLYKFERAWFGIVSAGQRITLQDYFLSHNHPAADAFFALPYGCFIGVTALYAFYLWFVDRRACSRFSWAFFVLNMMGILTYHLLPCAPPWYLHKYGCAIHLTIPEYEGDALARIDVMTGLYYFRGFYGRAAEVFGALPSLHVAYPLLMVFESWRNHRWPVSAGFVLWFLWMCCAAIYLDHHWLTDLVMGWAYALAVFFLLRRLIPVEPRVEDR